MLFEEEQKHLLGELSDCEKPKYPLVTKRQKDSRQILNAFHQIDFFFSVCSKTNIPLYQRKPLRTQRQNLAVLLMFHKSLNPEENLQPHKRNRLLVLVG